MKNLCLLHHLSRLTSYQRQKLASVRAGYDSKVKDKEWKRLVFVSLQGVFLTGPPQISLPDREPKQGAVWMISTSFRLLFSSNGSVFLLLYVSSFFFHWLRATDLIQLLSHTVPHTTPLVYFTPLGFSAVPMQQHFPIRTFPQHIGASPLGLQLFPALITHLGQI